MRNRLCPIPSRVRTFRSLIGLIRRCSIQRKLSLFTFDNFLFEGVFISLSGVKPIIDGVNFLVAEGTYHSWTEDGLSAKMGWRRHKVPAIVVVLTVVIEVRSALVCFDEDVSEYRGRNYRASLSLRC